MATVDSSDIKEEVRKRYGAVGKLEEGCCGSAPVVESSCCGSNSAVDRSVDMGYSEGDLDSLPDAANLGLGCGNPLALASLKSGETVLDLGSGGGIDCFLASKSVGETGHVIGVDMTDEMLERASKNATEGGYTNVEFRKGEIESLPVDDNTVDVVISNCVINLSPEKDKVFSEIHRVLKPGGRFYISDIVLNAALPESVQQNIAAYAGCVAGAMLQDEYIGLAQSAGLADAHVTHENRFPIE